MHGNTGSTDFGFAHRKQLSFLRTKTTLNESISAGFRSLQPDALDRYIIVQRYAPRFLDSAEDAAPRNKSKRAYYSVLVDEALRLENLPSGSIMKKGRGDAGRVT